RVDVHRAGDALTLKAITATGDTFLERSLPAAGPCEELEQAADAVLLAWEAQLPPGEVPVPVVERHEEPLSVPAPEPIKERLRVSAHGAAWLSAVGPVGGGGASLEWRPTRLPLALAFDVFGQGQRTVPLAGGFGTWSRLSFALGVTGSLQLDERVGLTFGVGAVGGPFWVNGANYSTSNHVLDWDAGAMASARLFLPGLWKVRPYVGVDAVVWLRRHQLLVTQGSSASQQFLPDFEVAPCAGLSWTL
ncbi:MAG TPA: hypothetical protein VFK87_11905, partial [Steroidobacteraceae bacterium]|nr:hypothetical protein [Steroidobacteraceae bacterium]